MIDINAISEATKANASFNESDYMKNGLLHCGECNTPKQHHLVIPELNTDTIVWCNCKCRHAEYLKGQEERGNAKARQQIENMRTEAIQDKNIRDWTFANDDNANPAMSDKASRYFSKWQKMYAENVGLLLWGNVGTGKTYFSACIANALIDNGVSVLTTNFAKIINALSGFNIADKNSYINDFNRYKLLVIDDLGAERQSEFAQEIVFQVIDARYRSGQPLIITTNLTLNEIRNPQNAMCSRIYDRIIEMCVPIQFEGESRRSSEYRRKIIKAKELFAD
jgi:DNA replication protein DnaC